MADDNDGTGERGPNGRIGEGFGEDSLIDFKRRLYGNYRNYLQHEDNLINNRISWMLTIHGFLYATYGFTLQKKIEIYSKLDGAHKVSTGKFLEITAGEYSFIFSRIEKTESTSLIFGLPHEAVTANLFMIMIAVVGYFISRYSRRSILAADQAAKSVNKIATTVFRHRRDEACLDRVILDQEGKFDLPGLSGGGSDKYTEEGFRAATVIPTVLILSWPISAILLILVDIFIFYN